MTAGTARYRLEDLLIDVPRQRVERDGAVLDVHGLSFRLLHHMLRQGQRVVGFDDLIEQVWAPAVVNEETVTQRVRLLRQALGDDGRNPRYLRSVRGRGYQLCAPPQVLDVAEDDAMPSRRSRRAQIVAAVGLVLAGVVGVWWLARPAKPVADPLLQRAMYYAGIGQRDDNDRAVALFVQRLDEAPDDHEAQLGLSRAYSARTCLFGGGGDWAIQAQRLAAGVVVVDPRNAAAHAALAYSHDCRGDIGLALRGYERAVRLDPSDDASRASAAYLYERKGRLADALAWNLAVRDRSRPRFLQIQVASNLALLGYTAAAEERYRRSFQLYPDNVFSNQALPAFLLARGRHAEAQAVLDEALGRGTDHAGLHLLAAELAWQRGDPVVAREAAARARALHPQGSLAQTVAWAVAAVPPPAAKLRANAGSLRRGLVAGDGDPLDGVDAALLLQTAGDRPEALAALAEAVSAGYRDAAYLRESPLFAPVRGEAGFAAITAAIEVAVERERMAVRSRGLDHQAAVTATP